MMLTLSRKYEHLCRKTICNGVLLTSRLNKSTIVLNDPNEGQYIQISRTPTFHFQPSLPRLPIPELPITCKKYLNAQEPLLSREHFDITSKCVKKFLHEEGPSLHKKLIEINANNPHTSYISKLWFDMYLRSRKPLPVNYNPFLIFQPESNAEYDMQLVKSTNLIISALRFLKSLRDKLLEPEVFHLNPQKSDTDLFRTVTKFLPSRISWYGAYAFKAFPLDMSQYPNLFNTTRIPELGKDRIYHNTSGKHIIVMRRGHFYTFDVLDNNNNIIEPTDIAASLKYILNDNIQTNECPIGVMTTSERDQWARTRSHLLQLGNQDTLERIDSAIFVVNLDDETIGNDYNKLIKTFFHGDGTNRWFDKSFALIITKDGYAGVNFEHSWGDGVAVLRFFNDVKRDISKNPRYHPKQVDDPPKNILSVQKLHISIDTEIKDTVNKQMTKYKNWIGSLCVNYLIHEGFGKKECKKFHVSPDAIMQLAFQLAFYKLENCVVPTYESCSTAAFKHGRTETIRPCTVQTKAFCSAMTANNTKATLSQLKQMIIDCSNAHTILTKDAAMGQGFDRHLFALNKVWEEVGAEQPAIFKDPAYDALNHNILSTSTLSSPAVYVGGFGPVEENGYGIGYMILDDKLGATVTSYNGNRNAHDYKDSLELAIKDIYKVLTYT